jgi:hypothetical protein
MKFQSNKLLGYDEDYHKHCDMCEEPVKEWWACEKCYHVECKSCREAYYELDVPMTHPCDWLQLKNKCYER